MANIASISTTNTKLGNLIHSWSVPAGKLWTCPGESSLCRKRCYAKSGFFRMSNVQESHKRNYKFSKQQCFSKWMALQLQESRVRVMRIHVAGDFYDTQYIQKWIEIVNACPRIQFFAYTRSWRIESMMPELVRLSNLENFQLWWSIDRETGPAPLIRGIRRAYMAIDDIDAQNAPDDCDLVFRDQIDTVMKKANGIQVCPPENGVTLKPKITCTRCGICWNKQVAKWEQTILPYFDPRRESVEINAPIISV